MWVTTYAGAVGYGYDAECRYCDGMMSLLVIWRTVVYDDGDGDADVGIVCDMYYHADGGDVGGYHDDDG